VGERRGDPQTCDRTWKVVGELLLPGEAEEDYLNWSTEGGRGLRRRSADRVGVASQPV
jgi:hypothetical protein